MTSSMLSGEKRWASSRRGGMTVLGKVAVPKPINLPSQRLENHGLDPNVEIVPKGTLSWGSRSSSASNAWGSSSLSPNTDGGAFSPSHLGARPSSGGSGTRPSTAGSDKTVEHTANAWVSNSRPSSASGALTSNQTSLSSVRPHSAETRPGSSQLSRFAEHSSEISGAWSGARTAEKLGVAQAKNNEFSLSSGDFPTLGSEKDKSVKNSELQDHSTHSRPGSSSGLVKVKAESSVVDDVSIDANVKDGAVNSWRRDYPAFSEDGVRPSVEKRQGNPQPYSNPGIPPQHYDTWHGPTMNNPQGGVWFRGAPGGPPFGNPVAPGGFSVEPFPYYRPHIPPAGLANPPPVPPPGPGPRGPHPKNGDVYMPHMPDAYIRPSMPIRPGFYPGPIPYEGYYSLPIGYHNSNERDVPFMGMAPGPHVYNRYLNQNPTEPLNSQGRSGGYGSAGKALTSEQVESSRPPDAGGPYRVLLKQHELDEKKEQSQLEDPVRTNESNMDRRDQPRITVLENEQKSDYRKNEEMDLRTGTHGEADSVQSSENQGSGPSVIKSGPLHSADNIKASEGTTSGVLELPLRPSAPKDSSLIQKIEGLNAKVRDNSSGKIREEQRNKFHVGGAPVNHQAKEIGARAAFRERSHTAEVISASPHEVGASGGEKNPEPSSFSGTATARRTTQAMQGRADNRNKGKITQDADGWRKKSVIADSPTLSAAQLELSSVHIGGHRISVENYDSSRSYHQTRHDGQSVQTMSDPSDSEAQRAKMKELAKQRTKQLQEEEEERTRKQKAKALAKLDELNRRAQVMEGSTEESATGYPNQNKREELQPSDLASLYGKSGAAPDSAIICNANLICQISEPSNYKAEKSPIVSSEPCLQTLENVVKDPVASHDPSMIIHQDVKSADVTSGHVHTSVASKQKRMSYSKQKQTQSSDQTSNQKIVPTVLTAPKDENERVINEGVPSGVANEITQTFDSGLPINSNALVESAANQKRKNNRNGKNKQKVEENSRLEALLSATPKEAHFPKSSVETDQPRALEFEIDQDAVQPTSSSKDPNQNSEQHRFLANEESHGRMMSQWKSQPSRRVPRNAQSNRQAEKFHGNDAVIWAPVKPQNKTEIVDELSDKGKIDTVNPVKGDQQLHNFSKNRRAEMERYIPKPFAKEMAQHGNIQQVPSISQITSVEVVCKTDSDSQGPQDTQAVNSAVGKVGSGMESKNVDGRLSKQGKTHGSWRQRGSTESTSMHDMQDGVNPNSKSDHFVQRSSGHQHGQKSEMSAVKGQTKHHTSISDLDGTNNSSSHASVALVSNPVIKDQIATGRGKRVPFRGHKSVGVNHDADLQKNEETEKIESQMSTSELSQADTGAAFKENRGVGERMISHWQPKSQPSNYQRGNRPNKQNVGSEVGQVDRKDSAHDASSLSTGRDKEPNDHSAPTHNEQSIISEKNKATEPLNVGNQEAKRERRNAPPRGRPHSPSQVPVNHVEQAPTDMDVRHEQRPSSGFRKNGNQNRFGRGQESRGDWTLQGQGNRHYSLSANREKQGQNLHYEYHPVGPYENSKSDNSLRSRDGNHSGVKFRERGQMHSRRGGANFNGR